MKAILLCAGYATRLYPLTIDKPKALLSVNGKPLLDYTIEKIKKELPEISETLVVSNAKFYPVFEEWARKYNGFVKTLDDNTDTNETRLGGLGDLWFAIQQEKINDDFLVILGDNLFDFPLRKFLDFAKEKGKTTIALYNLGFEEIKKMGCVELHKDRIVSFEEKPKNPKSPLCSTGIYFFKKGDIEKIEKYMQTPLPKDGPGFFVKHLFPVQEVCGIVLDGKWFDIGSKETYEKAQEEWKI